MFVLLILCLYILINNCLLNLDEQGNFVLCLELVIGVDIVYEIQGREGIQFSLGVYVCCICNVVCIEMMLIDGCWVVLFCNGGDVISMGLEMDVQFVLVCWIDVVLEVMLCVNVICNWLQVQDVLGLDNWLDK